MCLCLSVFGVKKRKNLSRLTQFWLSGNEQAIWSYCLVHLVSLANWTHSDLTGCSVTEVDTNCLRLQHANNPCIKSPSSLPHHKEEHPGRIQLLHKFLSNVISRFPKNCTLKYISKDLHDSFILKMPRIVIKINKTHPQIKLFIVQIIAISIFPSSDDSYPSWYTGGKMKQFP